MSLANCSRCGKVYPKAQGASDICPACIKNDEDNFSKVFHFFSDRPSATAQEIAQATEVDIKEIYRYVRENRLRLVKADTGCNCESCGIPISEGKICEKCRQKLSEEMKTEIDKMKQNHAKPMAKNPESQEPKYLKERREKGQN
jgi:flagellar operon protein (TIGR03826 family)